MRNRLKTSQIPPVRAKLAEKQGQKCALCQRAIAGRNAKHPCLDHDHITGYIRDVLCRNCNGLEGKIFNLARRCLKGKELEFLQRIVAYWERHKVPQHGGYIHPTFKTADEKRLKTNERARKKRAAAKRK